jgi:hypothetical protein
MFRNPYFCSKTPRIRFETGVKVPLNSIAAAPWSYFCSAEAATRGKISEAKFNKTCLDSLADARKRATYSHEGEPIPWLAKSPIAVSC